MAKTKQSTSTNKDAIRLYWLAMNKHPKDAALALLSPVGGVFMSVAVPFYAGRILAALATHHAAMADQFIIYLTISAALGILCNRIGFTRLMKLCAEVMSDLHIEVYARLLDRSTGYHSNQISGKLVSDAIDYVSAFNTLCGAIFVNGLPFLLIIIFGLAVVAFSSWILGLYLLIVVLVTLIWAYLDSLSRNTVRNTRLAANKKLISHLSDTVVNAQTVKTFANEETEEKTSKHLNVVLRDLRDHDWQKAGRTGNDRIGVLLGMQILLMIIVVHLGASSTSTLAIGIFSFTYIFTITTRLFSINDMTRQIEESLLQASPITKMLLEPVEVTDSANAQDLNVSKGHLSLEKVSFRYHDTNSDQTVFAGLDLSIVPGERVGLIGPSGGGKSTLTRLLLRFDDIDDGVISIDGQDIAGVTQTSLRRSISYVPQEPLLFHRSIKENIAYGLANASLRDITEAANKACADEFIRSLPHGYDTIVGERGVKLSGGQRQRVAIARAILKNAPILILDEATSALDSESEVMIQKALWELMKDRTSLVIAHRLSTIAKMDRIIVLDEGRITEQGNHAALLASDGLYARLWRHQSGGFIED